MSLDTGSPALGPIHGSWVLSPRFWVLGPGSWVLGPGSWVLGPGSWVLGPGSPNVVFWMRQRHSCVWAVLIPSIRASHPGWTRAAVAYRSAVLVSGASGVRSHVHIRHAVTLQATWEALSGCVTHSPARCNVPDWLACPTDTCKWGTGRNCAPLTPVNWGRLSTGHVTPRGKLNSNERI